MRNVADWPEWLVSAHDTSPAASCQPTCTKRNVEERNSKLCLRYRNRLYAMVEVAEEANGC
jgi:hypothetical protein